MADTSSCLSDAAKSVIERTITRLQNSITEEQIVAMKELTAKGQFFDVETLLNLADLTTTTRVATHGN